VVSNTLHTPLDESAKLLLFRGFSSRLLGILPAWLMFQPPSRRHNSVEQCAIRIVSLVRIRFRFALLTMIFL